jgi:two-component system NtrC family sensor kinase
VIEVEGEKNRVLLIEDNPGDARLIRELLSAEEGASFFLEHADRLSTGLTRLAQGNIDVILLDLSLPDSHGLDGLGKILAQTQAVPIVVLSGLKDEAVAIKAVQGGAQDYLVKGNIDSSLLVRSLHYAIERQRLRVALGESEARYRLLADNIADVIWTADSEARITYVSPSIKRVLGYTVEETLKLKISDILTPDSTEQARRFVKWQMKTFARGVQYPPASMTLEHVRKDGSTVWAEVMLSFMQDKNGNVTGIMGATRDITERRKAEEALQKSEARYRLLTDNAVDFIWTMDIKGRVTYASPSAERLFGYSVDELMALKINELFTPSSAETVRKAMKEEMATKATGLQDSHRSLLLEHVRKDGSTVWTEVMMSFLHDEQGRLIGVQGVTRDITERRKAEEALRESEQRYRLLAENVKDVIWTIDMNLRLSYTSPSITQLTGYPHEEYVTKTLEEILTPASVEFVTNLFAEELALDNSGHSDLFRARTFEAELICKDGSTVPVEMKATGLRDADGRPIGVLGVSRDISDRKLSEKALQQREQDYSLLLESTLDSIIVVDAETLKVIFGNRRSALMFGFDPVLNAGVGVNLLDFIHPEDREMAIKGFVEDLPQRDRRQRYDVRAKTRDGREIWVSALATRIDFQGRVGVLLSLRDVTKEKLMEEERERLEEELLLAGRLAAVGELAAGVAHELNNPLAAIQGFAQLLTKSNDLKEATKKDLNTIFREAQRAARITQNLLSFARRHEPEKSLISINEAIEKTLELHANPMKVNNIEVELELAPDLPKTLADFHQMQQVFVNIVNNAEQAMVDAHGKGRLVVKTLKAGNMIQISFADNGPGIPEENINRIFDPFFTTKEVGKGTGLGLSICYGLVEAHGGRIYAQSKLGQGATFVVEIPIVTEKQLVAEAALLKSGSRGVTWKKPKGQY